MENSQEKLEEIEKYLKALSEKYPQETGSFMSFLRRVISEKALDTKTKELIAMALGIATGCEWCIVFHTKNALQAGATPDELIEAGFVAVMMAGGPALMHLIPLMKAIEDFKQ
ncbi:MAG: carboxymuconolactone decarboxylase family protein [Euryarchaeota archaeon]|nr:carboxymuconolactone decarboxylase family protein [Euryarchaeota archaeon]